MVSEYIYLSVIFSLHNMVCVSAFVYISSCSAFTMVIISFYVVMVELKHMATAVKHPSPYRKFSTFLMPIAAVRVVGHTADGSQAKFWLNITCCI